MNGLLRFDPWFYRLTFVAVAVILLFFRLLPLNREAGSLPGPDLLLCIVFAWVMRRPNALPVPLIAVVIFAEDLILLRPPGLWTALVIMATEFLRSRTALTRELNFMMEWLLAAGLMIAMMLCERLLSSLALVPVPPFGFAAIGLAWTILAYPLVVGLSRLALRLQKPAQGQVDPYGRRM